MIIGVTGMPCSGTDFFGKFLEEKGFVWLSYSDILREELRKDGREVTRGSMIELADAMRKQHGNGILSERLIEKMENGKRYVVGNIRNPGEVEAMKESGNFFLVRIDASQKVRFERMKLRNREGDPLSWEKFLKLEEKDLGESEEAHGQQHAKVFAMADFVVENNLGEKDFRKRVEELLEGFNDNKP